MENVNKKGSGEAMKKNPHPDEIKDNSNNETISPFPEWNENIQKVIVGYH